MLICKFFTKLIPIQDSKVTGNNRLENRSDVCNEFNYDTKLIETVDLIFGRMLMISRRYNRDFETVFR
jgi:hypothetical protein